MTTTTVHLLRHGEVHNPTGILYGRMPGFLLSDLGHAMARRVADTIADRDIVQVWSSPLERAQQTAQPLAEKLGLEIVTDARVIESSSKFEGKRFTVGGSVLRKPSSWRYLWNPWRPSWGEPYKQVVARMMSAVNDARRAAEGHEAVVVSHQLPIWITRSHAERRSFVHDPRRRRCTLCSLTSFTFEGERLVSLSYSEPAADLIPVKARNAPFSAGGAPEQDASAATRE
ncbi:histidine phosphatase family protein [Nocardioides caldifontis]|uniref:histidine phosphatase family protein n=1 Tax=Nocardioides caldifontis TaxID=2588938 RepID=UPI0011E01EF8|nr:histidine phosphatase family protein [Nocardioides caldifontis]